MGSMVKTSMAAQKATTTPPKPASAASQPRVGSMNNVSSYYSASRPAAGSATSGTPMGSRSSSASSLAVEDPFASLVGASKPGQAIGARCAVGEASRHAAAGPLASPTRPACQPHGMQVDWQAAAAAAAQLHAACHCRRLNHFIDLTAYHHALPCSGARRPWHPSRSPLPALLCPPWPQMVRPGEGGGVHGLPALDQL